MLKRVSKTLPSCVQKFLKAQNKLYKRSGERHIYEYAMVLALLEAAWLMGGWALLVLLLLVLLALLLHQQAGQQLDT